ncbi:MAG: hypothetical protein ACYC21_10460 [Eubacteriales bacterium]
MNNAGIVLKVSPEEYRFLLSMRNAFISVHSLREALKNAFSGNVSYGAVVEDLLEQTW